MPIWTIVVPIADGLTVRGPVIHYSKHRARSVHPQSVPLSSHNKVAGRIPLTLTFHPHNISVKNITLKNFKLLQHDPTTTEIFAQPLLISYKRDKNLSNFLVKSTLKSDHQPGTFRCAHVRCRTCPFISNANKISESKRTSRAIPPISSTVLPVPYAKKYTSAKRAADWVIVSANTFGMLRLTIKTLLNQSRDISTSQTILKTHGGKTWNKNLFSKLAPALSLCGINESF